MVIKSSNGIERIEATKRVALEAQRGESKDSARQRDSSDQLTLTGTAKRLVGSVQSLGDGPPVDSARIEAIRQQLSEGGYQIDAERIAEALLRTERDLQN